LDSSRAKRNKKEEPIADPALNSLAIHPDTASSPHGRQLIEWLAKVLMHRASV